MCVVWDSVFFVTLAFSLLWDNSHADSTLIDWAKENDTRPLCECGHNGHSLETRVVGGHDAMLGEYPYATAIMSKRLMTLFGQRSNFAAPFCGGTLISDRHVLTAAHCVREKSPLDVALDISEYDLDSRSPVIRRYKQSVKLKPHPDYRKEGYQNDIGIIEFDKPITLDRSTRAAWVIGPNVEIPEGTTVSVFGWGRLEFHGSPSRVLQTLDMPVVNTEYCQKNYITKIVEEMMICAGGEEGKDACLGDSGSGLVTRVNNEDVLVGVVSFGRECALPDTPGVYTKVSSYTDWIYDETMNAGCRPCIAAPENFE